MKHKELLLGVDIGSVSVKLVLMDSSNAVVAEYYKRHKGEPLKTFNALISDLYDTYSNLSIRRLVFTGTGGKHIADMVGGKFVNEVVAHSEAVSRLYPEVRTVIEMGGEDSKLLIFGKSRKNDLSILDDFSMNTMCAAGTGSFLDQQAARLVIDIENDFGDIALTSENPPRIAGRCSVFAKSDMIHLQQIGTPVKDIVAGLCYALARSFKTSLGMGKQFEKPIMFEGGVAANKGLVRAFEDILGLEKGELIIPKYFTTMGAIGSIFITEGEDTQTDLAAIVAKLESPPSKNSAPPADTIPLVRSQNGNKPNVAIKEVQSGEKNKVFMGVDIGSLSTNLVLIDKDKNVVARRYLRTAGRPLDIVTGGLLEIEKEVGDRVEVAGVGVTGSGRYLVGKYVGADVIKNEITAQAAAAIHFVPDVDTIFEIGGQDSKYVSLNNGAVVDFEMNKVCAAGTGSFIEEQAEKLDINIESEFSNYAFNSKAPGRFGDRCTVFIESDLVSHQQKGAPKEDLVAGLAYSIVYNYLNKVVGDRKVGNRILFQGGVAWNEAVVEAFRKITDKDVIVPPHHDVTGAIGAALIAMNQEKIRETATAFKGFDLRKREYKVTTFECKHCANVCNISRVTFADEPPNFYGARCERYEKGKNKKGAALPDLFAEREKLLFGSYLNSDKSGVNKIKGNRPLVGIPRVLHIHDYFPYWRGFFHEVGFDIILSDTTNQKIINKTTEKVTAETCLPIKIIYGHCLNLMEKGVKNIFFPALISMEGEWGKEVRQNYSCPLAQTAPHMMIASLYAELNEAGVRLFSPNIELKLGLKRVEKELIKFGKEVGLSPSLIRKGMKAGDERLRDYRNKAISRGREILDEIEAGNMKGVLIVSRSYNGCDPGLNMDLPKKLKEMGVVAIPLDFVDIDSLPPSSDSHPNMYWKTGQTYLRVAKYLKGFEELPAIYLSSFKCGPDSFITPFFRNELKERAILELELDEHSADAGFVTRCEAFFDSVEYKKTSIGDIV